MKLGFEELNHFGRSNYLNDLEHYRDRRNIFMIEEKAFLEAI